MSTPDIPNSAYFNRAANYIFKNKTEMDETRKIMTMMGSEIPKLDPILGKAESGKTIGIG